VVIAKLKGLDSPDTPSLEAFRPQGPFGLYVHARVGPADGPGAELFGFTVCTPEWFAAQMKVDPVSVRHYVFVKEYNYEALKNFVSGYCSKCMGDSWKEVAQKVAHLGYWEFENYTPYSGPIR
jgi:Immunity protein 8